MKLRALFLFFILALALPAVASAQSSTSTATSTNTKVPAKPVCTITASPGAVYVGDTATLRWASQNATGGTITSLGTVGPSGIQGVIPTNYSSTFYGTFNGPGGTGTCNVTISILQGSGGSSPAPTAPLTPTASTQIKSGSGLIPCSGTDCEACHLASLAQGIINWLVGISIPLAAAMFAWAGIIYFTSGIESDWNKKSKAHSIFKSVGIGFLIVLCAWLGVQTVLKTVLSPGFYQSWNEIKCVGDAARPKTSTIQQMLSIIPFLRTDVSATTPANYGNTSFDDRFTGGGAAPTPSCGPGYYYSNEDGEDNCFNPDTEQSAEPTYSYKGTTISNAEMAAQLAAACSQYGIDNCAMVRGIAGNESGGGRDCRTSHTGAVGCMQVLSTTACSIDPNIEGCSTCKNSAKAGCATVAQAISDPGYNTGLGVRYIQQLSTMPALAQLRSQYGDCQITAAAYFQGPGKVLQTGGIPANAVSYANKACK